jgi:protoporphyrinogen oxidase
MDLPVAIIGAGLAGLCCARRLAELRIPFVIWEASDGIGGRVRTDLVDGFRLDRGFQIYLPSYPEGRRVLDYDRLDLRPFSRGAIVRLAGRFHRVADPRAELLTAVRSIFGPIGSTGDKLKLISFVNRVLATDSPSATDQPAIDLLRHSGFTDAMINRFFKPFLGGVFLDSDLATSSRFLCFVLQQFARGPGAVPAKGMGEIPKLIATQLPENSIQLSSTVRAIQPGRVELASGQKIDARAVVVATEAPVAKRLLGDQTVNDAGRRTVTLYFAATTPPLSEPMLVLNGDENGLVNSIVNLSSCSSEYAPPGQSLMSVSIIGMPQCDDESIEMRVRQELSSWYGDVVKRWTHLRTYRIHYALPDMSVGQLEPWQRPVRIRPGVYVAGDHRDQGSINGAMESGLRAAQAVAEDLEAKRV